VGNRTLNFSATGLADTVSNTVTVTPGAAYQLTIEQQPPASVGSGTTFAPAPTVQVRDTSGNAVATDTIVVTAAKASGSGTLGGTLTDSTDTNGLASFGNLNITGSGDHTIEFSAPGLVPDTSTVINVTTEEMNLAAIEVTPGSEGWPSRATIAARAAAAPVRQNRRWSSAGAH
jgi:hypothetical protein